MDAFWPYLPLLVYLLCEAGVGVLCYARFGGRGVLRARALVYPTAAAGVPTLVILAIALVPDTPLHLPDVPVVAAILFGPALVAYLFGAITGFLASSTREPAPSRNRAGLAPRNRA